MRFAWVSSRIRSGQTTRQAGSGRPSDRVAKTAGGPAATDVGTQSTRSQLDTERVPSYLAPSARAAPRFFDAPDRMRIGLGERVEEGLARVGRTGAQLAGASR
jgi:hypothetical protein